MPKLATYTLAWSPDNDGYEITERGARTGIPINSQADWFEWLDSHRSFSFFGRAGRFNLLKEARKGTDAAYWYAYHRQAQRVFKRYVGRSAQLTFANLEQLAREITGNRAIQTRQTAAESANLVPQMQTLRTHPPPVMEALSSAAAPLLIPKVQLPRLHSELIRRDRLLAKLDLGASRKVTLVSAPAGFGKTTLVRQWVAERSTKKDIYPAAWVTLDPNDNDPLRFWRYVITACQAFSPNAPDDALTLLQIPSHVPFKQSPYEPAITALLNQLAHAHSGILVLEDYHAITSPQIHETLIFLLDHLPVTMHVLIIARHDPPLPLIRLSAAGELCRIDPSDLRFSSEETSQFLQQAVGLTLPPDLVDLLERRVEGWAVGLRLLSFALEDKTSVRQIESNLRRFTGTHHAIQEYVVSEVLDQQPPAVQQFLLATSMLPRLNSSLCDAVMRSTTSAELLKHMDRGNVLLEPLDENNFWYRYHALFAVALQQEAQRRLGPPALRELAQRASDWYQQHGMLSEAVEAALQARDTAQAATLIGHIVGTHSLMNGPHIMQPGYHTLRRWLAQIPPDAFVPHPRLLLVHAMAIFFSFSLDMQPLTEAITTQIMGLLDRAEHAFRTAGNYARLGEVLAFRAMILRQQGEFGPAASLAKQALELLSNDDYSGRSLSLNAIGFLEVSQGRLDLAEQSIRAAHALCEKIGNPMYVRANSAMLGWTFFEQGKLYSAEAQLAPVLAEARAQGDTDDIARSLHALAEIAYEWNDLALAQRRIEESMSLSQHFAHVYEIHLAIVLALAWIEWARGSRSEALERIATLQMHAEAYQTPAQFITYRDICLCHAWFHLCSEDIGTARRLIARLPAWPEQPLFQRVREQQMEARILLAEGKVEEAVTLLNGTLQAIEAGGSSRALLHTQALLALAHAALQRFEAAHEMLYAVLVHSQNEGIMRLFLDEGRPMVELLHGILPSLREKHLRAYVRTILHASAAEQPMGTTTSTSFATILSPQERRVLHLLALGTSNIAIAQELVVSVNTVKAHLKNIYRKLGVSSRMEAAAVARSAESR